MNNPQPVFIKVNQFVEKTHNQELPIKTLTSIEVAEMVEKNHAHLLRDIRNYIKVISDNPKLDSRNYFIESSYINSQNKEQPMFLITKQGCELVANKMTGEKGILFTAFYVQRFNEMEIQRKLPTTYKEALLALVEAEEEKERMQLQLDHKEDVIIGLVDKVSLATKRQILNRVVRYKGANYRERWNELYKQFEMKYHINLSDRVRKYNANKSPKVKNKIDYIDKVMNKIPELYEIAVKLYETDIKALQKELYDIA
jgi:Rha family phage regulatory protein